MTNNMRFMMFCGSHSVGESRDVDGSSTSRDGGDEV